MIVAGTGSTYVSHFRSPLEFVVHAQWLMNSAELTNSRPTCSCRYCGRPRTKQKDILRRLKNKWAEVLAWMDVVAVPDTDDVDAVPDSDEDKDEVKSE